MPRTVLLFAALLAVLGMEHPAHAQSNEFRDARAHLGVGVGLFTYYGPADLTLPRSSANYVRRSDPALVMTGSFPVVRNRFYFRAMVGLTNVTAGEEQRLAPAAHNEFLSRPLFWFEPELVYTFRPGARSRWLPYAYSGFGGLVANLFGGEATSLDDTIPGPERSVFTFPVGVGVDVAVTQRLSFFVDASYRFNLNYVGRNEVQGRNPHNTSLIMGGVRLGLKNPFRYKAPEPPPIPEPLIIPAYNPPRSELSPPDQCVLADLNTIYFAYERADLDADARRLLDANVRAIDLNPACCITITGYTDHATPDAQRLARERAEAAYRYYVERGVAAERLRVRDGGVAYPSCDKEDEGIGCRRNRRVESDPGACSWR